MKYKIAEHTSYRKIYEKSFNEIKVFLRDDPNKPRKYKLIDKSLLSFKLIEDNGLSYLYHIFYEEKDFNLTKDRMTISIDELYVINISEEAAKWRNLVLRIKKLSKI